MYFTFAEKVGNSFLQEWHTRIVAFDSSRRYLYYSDALPLRRRLSPRSVRSDAASEARDPVDRNSFQYSPDDPINSVDMNVKPSEVEWKQKLKVLSVEPVMTQVEFTIEDPHLQERDLFRLRIKGEVRPLAPGETPPLGPLLCPSAALKPLPDRLTAENLDLIDDPLLLKEIFNSLRDQYQKINEERNRIEEEAKRDGQPIPIFSRQTIDSPKKTGGGFWFPSKKTILLRCRDEREFRRFWYLLQIVLGYDKLFVRPYRGLPPFDPRNGISFAHIPIYIWHTFKDLDRAVYYVFTRGILLNCTDAFSASATTSTPTSRGDGTPTSSTGSAVRVEVALKSAFLSITHDMVLVMRNTGNIPRWVRLQEVNEFHFNITASQPFVVFLTDSDAPDIIFVPQPPLFGPDVIRNYDPRYDVKRIEKVIRDSCFASHSIRRVIKIKEVKDHSLVAYTRRSANSGRPLCTTATAGYTSTSTVSCPLPKEQLAAVWNQVQNEMMERSSPEQANRLAIPLYSDTSTNINLTPEELTQLGRRLASEREGRDDIVGVPLSEIRQTEAVDPVSRGGLSSSPPAEEVTVLPLTVELLHTPQLLGGRVFRRRGAPSEGGDTSEASDYFSSYAGYEPREHGAESIPEAEEQCGASFSEAPQKSIWVRHNSKKLVKKRSGTDCSFEERRVDELVQCSIDALAVDGTPLVPGEKGKPIREK